MQQMATCTNCGSQNAANQQFCVSCGAHLGGTARPVSHVPIITGVAASTPMMGSVVTQQPLFTASLPAAPRQTSQVDVKPTWGLAWGLFWRMLCLMLFMGGLIFLIYMLARMAMGYSSVFGVL
ncbi:MAG: zinc ribbon domain-containing protein [Chloroflexi bacterium]|nr:zinc ribbon domain-containing protein [Chloroflexota bacterium]